MGKKKKSKKNRQKQMSEIKISEAILRIAEPEIKRYWGDIKRLKVVISATVMAWNLSILPPEKQGEFRDDIIKSLPEMGIEDTQIFLEYLSNLEEKKRKYFPEIQVMILKHEMSFTGGNINLNIASTPIPEIHK